MKKEMSHNLNKNWKLWSLVICTCVIGACLYFSKTPDESHQTAEQWYPIAPGSLTNTLGLIGHVEAVEQKTLSAPFDGVLEKINVQAGDSVKAGDMLFTMGTLELDIQIRNALSELLKTKREVVRLKNWDQDPEVHRLRRQVSIATAVLNNSRKNLKETTELYDRGIVARNEVDNLRLQIQTQDQDLKNAREDLATLESRADKDSLQIAEIAFLNAQALYESLRNMALNYQVRAPFDGVIVPAKFFGGDKRVIVESGQHISQGNPVFSITGLKNFKVLAHVQESDISLLKEGMPVTVSGEGFGNVSRQGKITRIAFQNSSDQNSGGLVEYEITVSLSPEQIKKINSIKLGMSATLEVLVYSNPHGIAVPPQAIMRDNDGNAYVLYRNAPHSSPVKRPITTGKSVSAGIEVFGLESGEVLLKN